MHNTGAVAPTCRPWYHPTMRFAGLANQTPGASIGAVKVAPLGVGATPVRNEPPRAHGADASRLLSRLVIAALVLNIADALCTMGAVSTGLATEANPLMAMLINISPTLFLVAKVVMVSGGLGVLWKLRQKRFATAGIVGAFAVYAVIFCFFHLPQLPNVLRALAFS